MKYGKWNLGQIEALLSKIGDENARGILDGTVEFAVAERAGELLRSAGAINLPTKAGLFDPKEYFQTRSGLYVSDWFENRVLVHAHKLNGFASAKFRPFDLGRRAGDIEICFKLPEGYVFGDPSEFCAILARMIDLQPNGEGGYLITSGDNIFYVEALTVVNGIQAVIVDWLARDLVWRVRAYRLSDGEHDEGSRVFSAPAKRRRNHPSSREWLDR